MRPKVRWTVRQIEGSAFGYAGGFGYQEDASGLKLLGHRYYDSSTGRFLTRDPIKDGRNWNSYGAGEGNPISGVDPTGLRWHDPVQVQVDPNFHGTVIAFGDFSWMKGDSWRDVEVPAGYVTDPRMDVDLIIVVSKSGVAKVYFLPGRLGGASSYRLDSKGVVRSGGTNGAAGQAHPGGINSWIHWWFKAMEDALNTGFPKEYEPRPNEVCRVPRAPYYWPNLFPSFLFNPVLGQNAKPRSEYRVKPWLSL
ncbi:MAG: RHS repeat-associated core domain-containing protein [Fimbriimonadaceae bacterium]|jgi:RHS repeat-associated protein|nr:RHS repeat-associated core domain-containing protein [Fimbriimonadaceae bacterium]